MFMLCVLGGLYLLTQAPAFFLPSRGDPAIGLQFDALASRLLGAGLLALAAVGGFYLRAMYYAEERRLPGPAEQRRYFRPAAAGTGPAAGSLAQRRDRPEPRLPATGTTNQLKL